MISTYFLPLFATFILAKAGTNGTLQETGLGPGPTDEDVFRNANLSPNATGTVNIQATNMNVDPETGASALWHAHLNITEVTNINYTLSPSTDVITNSVIAFDPLGSWVETPNWDTIVIIFLDVARNATVDGQKDDGNCYATLGEECVIEYMMDINAAILLAPGGDNTTEEPFIPPPPTSCKNRLSGAISMNHFNSTYADGSAYLYSSSPAHNASNTTFYQEATTRVWPIFFMQIGWDNVLDATGFSSAHMRCLRANSTTKGSKAIGGVPGAAVSTEAFGWTVMGIACLAGSLLL